MDRRGFFKKTGGVMLGSLIPFKWVKPAPKPVEAETITIECEFTEPKVVHPNCRCQLTIDKVDFSEQVKDVEIKELTPTYIDATAHIGTTHNDKFRMETCVFATSLNFSREKDYNQSFNKLPDINDDQAHKIQLSLPDQGAYEFMAYLRSKNCITSDVSPLDVALEFVISGPVTFVLDEKEEAPELEEDEEEEEEYEFGGEEEKEAEDEEEDEWFDEDDDSIV